MFKKTLFTLCLAASFLVSCAGGATNQKPTEPISIKDIKLTSTDGLTDIYTITFTDGSTTTFKVTNGSNGEQGIQGEPGKDGSTPTITIGENGNWFIDGVDSGVSTKGETGSQGESGAQGEQGKPGESGHIGENGNWWVGDKDTGISAHGFYDKQGLLFHKLSDNTFGVSSGTATHLADIVIPSAFNNLPVTKIVDNGFSYLPSLKSIMIPSTITEIGKSAFECSINLKTVMYDGKLQDFYIIETDKKYNAIGFNEKVLIGDQAFNSINDILRVSFTDGEKLDEVKVSIDNYFGKLESIDFDISLNEFTDINSKGKIKLPYDKNSYTTTIKAGTYGLFKEANITLNNDSNKTDLKLEGLAVTNPVYNFAPLNGTYPVLVYSLKLKDITKNGEIPSFVYLERSDAYNWDKLPYGLSYLPNVSRSTATRGDFHALRSTMSSYIKELYELNNESKFNLYTVDNYPHLALEMLTANRIPEDNWTLTMLSDGSGTAAFLESTFAIDNPQAKFDKMLASYEKAKIEIFKSGSYSDEWLRNNVYDVKDYFSILAAYPYVLAKSYDNIDWWVNRLRVGENLSKINEKDPGFAADIASTPKSFYTNNLLASLSEDEKKQFKELYHFSDEMFKESQENGQKIMIILGTSWAGEKESFYNYLKMTMDFYGTEYDYYYKGHPGFPTSNFPERGEQLDKLRKDGYTIKELDNAIAAEVILFYNPDVYMCGWSSSTFDSVESEHMACSLFEIPLADKGKFTYGDLIDLFITKVKKDSPLYKNESLKLDVSKTYYLMEFNNTSTSSIQMDRYNKHEIAIYDTSNSKTYYYKLVEGETYKEVDVDGKDIIK